MVYSLVSTLTCPGHLYETELLEWLKEVPNWQEVAIHLLPEETAGKDIETIEIDYRKVEQCQIALARQFVHSQNVEVSWKRVYEAFKKANYINVARKIKETYNL